MMNKITYAQALATVIEGREITAEVMEKLVALKASVEKRHGSGSKKPTAKQTENEATKAMILELLSDGERRTVGEIAKGIPTEEVLSGQKVNALVKQLKDEGKVAREEEKGKAYFSII